MSVVKLREFKIAWLHAFVCVCRLGGYSAAATHLGIKQSTVSRQVAALEQWLGKEILTKNKPPRLTDYGKSTHAMAEKVLFDVCDLHLLLGRAVRLSELDDPDRDATVISQKIESEFTDQEREKLFASKIFMHHAGGRTD